MTNRELIDLCNSAAHDDPSVKVPVKDLRRVVADSDSLRTLVSRLRVIPGDFAVVTSLPSLAS